MYKFGVTSLMWCDPIFYELLFELQFGGCNPCGTSHKVLYFITGIFSVITSVLFVFYNCLDDKNTTVRFIRDSPQALSAIFLW